MATKDFTQSLTNLFDAIKIIAQNEDKKIVADKTLICSIINKQQSKNRYKVSYDNTILDAEASNNEIYPNGTQVYVSFPEGNYNNVGLILGIHTTTESENNDNSDAVLYANFVDLTGNLVTDLNQTGIIGNYYQLNSPPASYRKVGTKRVTKSLYGWQSGYFYKKSGNQYVLWEGQQEYTEADWYSDTDNDTDVYIIDVIPINEGKGSLRSIWSWRASNNQNVFTGYDLLSISAEINTSYLAALNAAEGSYSIIMSLYGEQDSINFIEYESFSSTEMFGNPLNYCLTTTQRKIIDISKTTNIRAIEVYLQEDNNFKDKKGELIQPKSHKSTVGNIDPAKYEDYINIIVSGLEIQLGCDKTKFDKDQVFLSTPSSLTYLSREDAKRLYTRWIHKNTEDQIIAVYNNDTLPQDYDTTVHIYNFDLTKTQGDELAGPFWNEITTEYSDPWNFSYNPNAEVAQEKLKVIIEYPTKESIENLIQDDETLSEIFRVYQDTKEYHLRAKLYYTVNKIIDTVNQLLNDLQSLRAYYNSNKDSLEILDKQDFIKSIIATRIQLKQKCKSECETYFQNFCNDKITDDELLDYFYKPDDQGENANSANCNKKSIDSIEISDSDQTLLNWTIENESINSAEITTLAEILSTVKADKLININKILYWLDADEDDDDINDESVVYKYLTFVSWEEQDFNNEEVTDENNKDVYLVTSFTDDNNYNRIVYKFLGKRLDVIVQGTEVWAPNKYYYISESNNFSSWKKIDYLDTFNWGNIDVYVNLKNWVTPVDIAGESVSLIHFQDFVYNENKRKARLDAEADYNSKISYYTNLTHYYESNEIVFSNTVDVDLRESLKLIKNLEIICDPQGYNGKYFLYNTESKYLLNVSEGSRLRKLTVNYENLITGVKKYDTVESIRWEIPINNTMIKHPENNIEYYEGSGVSRANDPYLEKAQEEGNYFIIERKAIPVDSDVNIGDAVSRSVEQTFRIKEYYEDTAKNNTVRCIITKNGIEYIISYTLSFGVYGSNGTDYTLAVTMEPPILTVPKSGHNGTLKTNVINEKGENVVVDRFDYSFVNQNVLFDCESNSVGGMSIIQGYSSASGDVSGNAMSQEDPTVNTEFNDYRFGILKVTANSVVQNIDYDINDSGRNINLTTYFPIPIRSTNDILYYKGNPFITYDVTGANPQYYKNKFEVVYSEYADIQPRASNQRWILEHTTTDKNFNPDFYPKISEDGILSVPSLYIINAMDHTQIAITHQYRTSNESDDWISDFSLPLYISQRVFSSSLLNSWDGELKIDEDNGTIMAPMMGAGFKDSENRFNGVLMGDISKTDQISRNDTGIYGYHEGSQSFGFKINGTAFIGKSGSGQIQFDGNSGTITSASYRAGSTGMEIDLDNGQINIRGIAATDYTDKTTNRIKLGKLRDIDTTNDYPWDNNDGVNEDSESSKYYYYDKDHEAFLPWQYAYYVTNAASYGDYDVFYIPINYSILKISNNQTSTITLNTLRAYRFRDSEYGYEYYYFYEYDSDIDNNINNTDNIIRKQEAQQYFLGLINLKKDNQTYTLNVNEADLVLIEPSDFYIEDLDQIITKTDLETIQNNIQIYKGNIQRYNENYDKWQNNNEGDKPSADDYFTLPKDNNNNSISEKDFDKYLNAENYILKLLIEKKSSIYQINYDDDNTIPHQSQVLINSIDPYFTIMSPNATIMKVGINEYYLQTENYSVKDRTGVKLDLKNGDLIGYNFMLKAESDVGFIKLDSSGDPFLQIRDFRPYMNDLGTLSVAIENNNLWDNNDGTDNNSPSSKYYYYDIVSGTFQPWQYAYYNDTTNWGSVHVFTADRTTNEKYHNLLYFGSNEQYIESSDYSIASTSGIVSNTAVHHPKGFKLNLSTGQLEMYDGCIKMVTSKLGYSHNTYQRNSTYYLGIKINGHAKGIKNKEISSGSGTYESIQNYLQGIDSNGDPLKDASDHIITVDGEGRLVQDFWAADNESYFPFIIGSHFAVDWDGTMWAKDGIFDGMIYAVKGRIGGWKIGDTFLTADTGATSLYSADQAEADTSFRITVGGYSDYSYNYTPISSTSTATVYVYYTSKPSSNYQYINQGSKINILDLPSNTTEIPSNTQWPSNGMSWQSDTYYYYSSGSFQPWVQTYYESKNNSLTTDIYKKVDNAASFSDLTTMYKCDFVQMTSEERTSAVGYVYIKNNTTNIFTATEKDEADLSEVWYKCSNSTQVTQSMWNTDSVNQTYYVQTQKTYTIISGTETNIEISVTNPVFSVDKEGTLKAYKAMLIGAEISGNATITEAKIEKCQLLGPDNYINAARITKAVIDEAEIYNAHIYNSNLHGQLNGTGSSGGGSGQIYGGSANFGAGSCTVDENGVLKCKEAWIQWTSNTSPWSGGYYSLNYIAYIVNRHTNWAGGNILHADRLQWNDNVDAGFKGQDFTLNSRFSTTYYENGNASTGYLTPKAIYWNSETVSGVDNTTIKISSGGKLYVDTSRLGIPSVPTYYEHSIEVDGTTIHYLNSYYSSL